MDLEELRRLAKAATPGPWHYRDPWKDGCVRPRGTVDTTPPDFYDPITDGELSFDLHAPSRSLIEAVWHNDSTAGLYGRDEDAAFMAAANPQTVLALIDEIESLRGRVPER